MTISKHDSSLGFDSPIGPISIYSLSGKITKVTIGVSETSGKTGKELTAAKKQILSQLSGKASTIDVPYEIHGTPFQMAVWKEIAKLKFGETTTYGQIAIAAGNPKAVRAVGAAVGANPIPLVIPCHRVLGSDARITGYSGGQGIPTKRQLLAIEKISYRE